MKVVELTAPRLDALHAASHPDPQPRAGEVVVRLRAAALNFLDIAVAKGMIPIPCFPIIPVTDGAGEIAAIGEGVDGWAVGDRVVPHFMPDWQDGRMTSDAIAARRGLTRAGSLAQLAAVPARSLVRVPDHLDLSQAATLPIAATTAWRAVRVAALGPQSTALLLGTGGVSIFTLQFAKASGARVIITSSSDEKLARATALGADMTVNYKDIPAWDAEVLCLTDGRGVDLVLETGGSETLPRSLNAAAMNAVVFVIGFLSGARPSVDIIPVIEKGLRIHGNNAGPIADLIDAAAAIAAHQIVPLIGRSFSMSEAAEAYAYLAAGGQHFGKVTIHVD